MDDAKFPARIGMRIAAMALSRVLTPIHIVAETKYPDDEPRKVPEPKPPRPAMHLRRDTPKHERKKP